MIDVKIKGNIKFPKVTLQNELSLIAERIIIPEMVKGIDSNRGVDGKQFPELNAKTRARKGHGRPLIDTGKLRSAFIHKKKGKFAVIVTLKNNFKRREIGEYLQIDGIRSGSSGRKFFRFFGISKKAEKKAIEFMGTLIRKRVKNA